MNKNKIRRLKWILVKLRGCNLHFSLFFFFFLHLVFSPSHMYPHSSPLLYISISSSIYLHFNFLPLHLTYSKLLPKHQNTSSLIWVWWDKNLANVPLKDMSMERVRVKEFGESNDKDCGWVNLVFSRVSLSKFSLEALYISWIWGYL